jgi:hypothetical protein
MSTTKQPDPEAFALRITTKKRDAAQAMASLIGDAQGRFAKAIQALTVGHVGAAQAQLTLASDELTAGLKALPKL